MFYDGGTHQLKHLHDDNIQIIAGSGNEGKSDGMGEVASLGQVTSLCYVHRNLFMVDVQAGTLRLVTSMSGTRLFLANLDKLYAACKVHLKVAGGVFNRH